MIYYIDFEFIEGFYKPTFGKRRHFIDIISVGIVASDGEEYYAISNEFDLKGAWNRWQWEETNKTDLPGITRSKIKKYWLRDNVLKPIWIDLEYRGYREDPNEWKQEFYDILDRKSHDDQLKIFAAEILPHGSSSFTISRIKQLLKKYGKSNNQIANEIFQFISPTVYNLPIFYGYYSAYDHVLLCSLWGTMMQLPPLFPMYTRDLKQMVDNWAEKAVKSPQIVRTMEELQNPPSPPTFDEWLTKLKAHPNYPKQQNEHNALADARWNRDLHKFLIS